MFNPSTLHLWRGHIIYRREDFFLSSYLYSYLYIFDFFRNFVVSYEWVRSLFYTLSPLTLFSWWECTPAETFLVITTLCPVRIFMTCIVTQTTEIWGWSQILLCTSSVCWNSTSQWPDSAFYWFSPDSKDDICIIIYLSSNFINLYLCQKSKQWQMFQNNINSFHYYYLLFYLAGDLDTFPCWIAGYEATMENFGDLLPGQDFLQLQMLQVFPRALLGKSRLEHLKWDPLFWVSF